MDKQLLKAYIRTIVEDEIKRVLPEILSEAVAEIKQLSENTTSQRSSFTQQQRPKLDRAKLASMMGVSFDGETIRATSTDRIPLPEGAPKDVPKEVVDAVTRDYSALMKKMGLSK